MVFWSGRLGNQLRYHAEQAQWSSRLAGMNTSYLTVTKV